jgi:metallo-beta-lactamase class B
MTNPATPSKLHALRWVLFAGATLLIVAVALIAPHLDFAPPPPAPPVSKILDRKPVAVAPGIYLLGKLSPGAAYVVDTSDGLVLIDSGLEASAKSLTDQVSSLHLDIKRLRAILLTHGHADHSLGAEELRKRWGAKVHAGKGDCDALRKGESRERFFSTFYMPQMFTHPTTIDVELTGGESLTFGDATFEVIATPGHTAGSVCYLLQKGDLRVLFTGDVMQSVSPSTTGALGTYAAYLPPLYGGSAKDYLATLQALKAMPMPDMVLPGHPSMDTTPQATRITAERWNAILDAGLAEMQRLLARYEADGANFLDGVFKQLLPGLYYLGNIDEKAVYAFATPKGVILVNAPGGADLTVFLKERLRKIGLQDHKLLAVLLTSIDPRAIAGLEPLVRQTGCKVVVSKAGVDTVTRRCPTGTEILHEDDLKSRDWLKVRAISLDGRGEAPLAYEVRWAEKTVLLTGPIPVKPGAEALEKLQREGQTPDQIARYVKSLDELAKLAPQLWLPVVPIEGQNANLYDREWERVLTRNKQAMSY